MSKELNCMNCSIGDFKHELCDCDNGFCKEFKSIGTQEDFFNAVIQRIRPQDDWIPVSERLPEGRKEVLVYLSTGRMTIANYNEHKLPFSDKAIGWGYSPINGKIDFAKEDVIAWMPLPKPYKGGDTE